MVNLLKAEPIKNSAMIRAEVITTIKPEKTVLISFGALTTGCERTGKYLKNLILKESREQPIEYF